MSVAHIDKALLQESDEQVAARVLGGNTEAFGVLVARYEQKLLRYGTKFVADREDIKDVVQDVFISAYRNMQSFDTSLRFSPWIYRMAHNAFVNALKKKSINPFVSIDLDTLLAHPVYEDPLAMEREQGEMRKMIDKGL